VENTVSSVVCWEWTYIDNEKTGVEDVVGGRKGERRAKGCFRLKANPLSMADYI
jgi:hypothetical protein